MNINYTIKFIILGISIFLFFSFSSFLLYYYNIKYFITYTKDSLYWTGVFGNIISRYIILNGIGISAFFIPIFFLLIGISLIKNITKYIYPFIFCTIFTPLFIYIIVPENSILSGYFGCKLGKICIKLFGKIGSYFIVILILKYYFLLMLKKKKEHKNVKIKILKRKKKILKKDNYPLKKSKKKYINTLNTSYAQNIKNKIIYILNFYKIKINHINVFIGPTITLYEIFPEIGHRISKIKCIENDIALNLSIESMRIIYPIPGRRTIGIEIPNTKREILYIEDILFCEKIKYNENMILPISFGKTIFNEIFIIDIIDLPHLLISGSTGQGKSIGLNIIIIFLLYNKSYNDFKFVLIDPKKVELSIYKNIPHSYFATLSKCINNNPIITNLIDTKKILQSLCKEMDKRYILLEKYNVRNIQEYNKIHNKKKLPYIILIIDEFADLIISKNNINKKIEEYIIRLSQLARAIGIHLIISTQRPSVNVINGLIKSNFTSRISFKVGSKIDSRIILDCAGAEQLIGKGDLLFYNKNKLIRLQCPFIDSYKIQQIVNYYGNKYFNKNKKYFLPDP